MFSESDVAVLFDSRLTKTGNYHFTQCPFPEHNDEDPSFALRLDKGTFRCFGCGKYGRIEELPALLNRPHVILRNFSHSFKTSNNQRTYEDKIVEESLINSFQKILWMNPNHLNRIRGRVPNDQIIKDYKLGYYPKLARYSFPIYENGVCRNVKLMSFNKTQFKQINWGEGFGKPRLYGRRNLFSERIIICAGEWDCLVLQSFGFPAIANTAGENTWFDDWSLLFQDKRVFLVFDQDETGEKSRIKIAKSLTGIAKSIHLVDFDLDMGKGGDASDYFMKFKKTAEDFVQCLRNSKRFKYMKEETALPVIPFSL